MSDLVGRTISASERNNDAANYAPRRTTGGDDFIPDDDGEDDDDDDYDDRSTIATDDVARQYDIAQLYNLVDKNAVKGMSLQQGGGEGGGGQGGGENSSHDNSRSPAELARARDVLGQTWSDVRSWIADHPDPRDRREAATHIDGKFLTTALHVACKLSDPPSDVISSLIGCAPEVASWPDSQGWLPLHYACANGASGRVLGLLVKAYPDGKVQQDKRYRTPLHFAFFRRDDDARRDGGGGGGGRNRDGSWPAAPSGGLGGGGGDADDDDDDDRVGNTMPEIVWLLADSGAAELQDEGGMLPLHYASAYGTTREVLEVLLENYPESITRTENKGRNPLHLAMVNAHRQSSPKVVGFLLERNADDIVNVYDDDNHLPIHLLAMASKFPPEKSMERKNAADCLTLYLGAKPKASADFLTAIQTLPEWLRDIAVISDHMQDILNQRIVMRFPTMILILDLMFLLLAIVLFEISSSRAIDYLFTEEQDPTVPPQSDLPVIFTLVCGAYFLLREIVQVLSLIALGNFSSWVWDMSNWLDMLNIFFIFYFGAIMLTNEPLMSMEAFRSGVAVTKGILWMSVISFLKSTQVEFSVFVSGVFYVVQRLAAFILALLIILLMFAQMFYIVYAESDMCACTSENGDANPFPHCTFQNSLLKVFTMMMGEIGNEMRYSTLPVAQFLYIAFAFLVIILLSNVLIAIVTDSYGVIKNERAAMVFWSNRLDFVAEIDAIKNIGSSIKKYFSPGGAGAAGAPRRVRETVGGEPIPVNDERLRSVDVFRNAWKSLMNLFDPHMNDSYDVSPSSFEFWCYILVRLAAVFIVIPVWLLVGLASAGWLWPPQVREYLLKQKKVAISRADMAEQVTTQMTELQNEIWNLRAEIRGEVLHDRKEFLQVKAEVEAVQAEVMADLLQVKEIMVTLLEMSKDHLRSGNRR